MQIIRLQKVWSCDNGWHWRAANRSDDAPARRAALGSGLEGRYPQTLSPFRAARHPGNRDVVPGSLAARFLHGELSAGFHVLEARQRTDCETSRDPAACERGDQADLYPPPDDLDTIIPMIHVDVTQGVGGILPSPWLTLEELQYPDGSPGREG